MYGRCSLFQKRSNITQLVCSSKELLATSCLLLVVQPTHRLYSCFITAPTKQQKVWSLFVHYIYNFFWSVCLQKILIVWLNPTYDLTDLLCLKLFSAFTCTSFHKQTVLTQWELPGAQRSPTDRLELHGSAEWRSFSNGKCEKVSEYLKKKEFAPSSIHKFSTVSWNMYEVHDFFLWCPAVPLF